MGFKKISQILVVFLVFLFSANSALAAFGISPPHVKCDKLVPGAHYEQRILLSRSNTGEDVQGKVIVDTEELKDWISVSPGFDFVLPKGQAQVPIIIKVDVPKDAELGKYQGTIRIKVEPPKTEGQVSISLGAQLNVDLLVGDEGIVDFLVRTIKINDGIKKPWPMKYFNKISVSINLENTGNVPGAPSKVEIEVWDAAKKEVLALLEDIDLEKIEPYETKQILAKFPIPAELELGEYFGYVKIFKGEEMVHEWNAGFNIILGSLSNKDYLLIIGVGSGALIVAAGLILTLILSAKRKKKRARKKTNQKKRKK